MKKLCTVFFCLLFCLFFLCGCRDAEQQQIQLTLEQFIQNDEKLTEFVISGDRFPKGFLRPELEGYGRIISSSENVEEAQTIAKEHFSNEDYAAIVYDVRDETETFFGLSVEWSSRDPDRADHYTENVISFRMNVYDYDTQTIYTNDTSLIESILNYNYYEDMYQTQGSKVIFADLMQTQNSFVYSIYYTGVVYGDWGLKDKLFVFHDVLTMDKESRIIKKDCQQLRKLFCEVSPEYHY